MNYLDKINEEIRTHIAVANQLREPARTQLMNVAEGLVKAKTIYLETYNNELHTNVPAAAQAAGIGNGA